MKRDKFAGRYAIKLASSILIALCNVVIQFLLPRAVSVEEYGFYSYNLNVFTSVVVMMNLSASSALVAKYSKKCEDIGYVRFYFRFFGSMTIVLTSCLLILYNFDVVRESFGGQTILSAVLGLEFSVLMKFLADIISIYDAAAISRFPSVIQVFQRIVLCVFVMGTYFLGKLNLVFFYIGQISIIAIVIIILIKEFFKDYKLNYSKPIVRETRIYFTEFYNFCRPLVVAGVISQGIIILMNFSLMKFSGVYEQAMFGVAWQLNTLLGYFFSPYAELMKREFAVLTNNTEVLKHRLWQSVRIITWITTYLAIFIAVNADRLLPILYGKNYFNAVSVTQMIMIYTIFQAWGQIIGSFLIATEETKGFAILSVVGQFVSVICVFLFQIPNFIFVNGLGSTGIGLTYMCANYLSCLAMVAYILKKDGGSYMYVHNIYISAIASCAVVAYFVRMMAGQFFWGQGFVIETIGLGINGLFYTVIIGLFIYNNSNLIGVQQNTINTLLSKVVANWEKR